MICNKSEVDYSRGHAGAHCGKVMFAQLYGILPDGTPGPLVQATATSALLGLALADCRL